MTDGADRFVPVANVVRNDRSESVHYGAVVGLDPDGSVAFALGDPEQPMYPRSSLKPMQAAALGEVGLQLPRPQMALACASHDGTRTHTETVEALLGAFGLDRTALQNTPDRPLELEAREDQIRAGLPPCSLTQNCSGKHAAMLATCVVNGWPLDGYLDREHPVQLQIERVISSMTGGVDHVGVDGCGAPTHSVPLIGAARAFAELARRGSEQFAAMRAHPELVGGRLRDDTILMQHLPGVMVKDGAEGVQVLADADGRAIAVKIADGGGRARAPVMVAALRRLGYDVTEIQPRLTQYVFGHGRPVGQVDALF